MKESSYWTYKTTILPVIMKLYLRSNPKDIILWYNYHVKNMIECLICEKFIYDNDFSNIIEHALLHIKEHNLLAFL